MLVSKTINKKEYIVKEHEFFEYKHPEFNFLKIFPEVGILERFIGMISDIATDIFQNKCLLTIVGENFDNFVAKNFTNNFDKIFICRSDKYIEQDKLHFVDNDEAILLSNIVFCNFFQKINQDEIDLINNNTIEQPFILCAKDDRLQYKYSFALSRLNTFDSLENYYLYVPDKFYDEFMTHFYYYFTSEDSGLFVYNNLIHLCVMVKNGGVLFAKMLKENLPYIDRWTVLDTGSTDDTIENIKTILANKKGKLYQEPFINFRDSRNHCLEFAGKTCKYNIMLDDTYVLQGDIRIFLEVIRGDQFADSYSIVVQSDDMEYYSNRVTKSENELRYIYKIHEVITNKNNINVVVPKHIGRIFDYRADYMEKRTIDRKYYDLKLLYEEIEEDSEDPRHYYYLAQTYSILNQHEKAAENFLKRFYHHNDGFLQEKVDSMFEAARIYNFKLNKPWQDVEKMYLTCIDLDPERPESFYFIGIHYYLEKNYKKAYPYFAEAFKIGFPLSKQFSLRPTLSFHYLPKFLAELCYIYKNYELGFRATSFFLEKNKPSEDSYSIMTSWHSMFSHLIQLQNIQNIQRSLLLTPNQKTICFIVDGGYSTWSGKDILTKGVGGSETWAIEMARYIKRNFNYNVIVFCKCEKQDNFENVIYIPLNKIYSFLKNNLIHTCIVSRFTEYLPIAYEGNTENVYLILHDIGPIGEIIPKNKKLKKVICLSEWHASHFQKSYPILSDITDSFHYGVDITKFKKTSNNNNETINFIYSSFPNRGLSVLLKMWDKIKQYIPNAILHIFSDVYGQWVNQNYPQEMEEIKNYLFDNNDEKGIIYHGWVSKEKLANAWKNADVWFYPCKFAETFCLTALESAISKTLVITNDLAALQNTVGNRGVVIKGDVTSEEWQQNALQEIIHILSQENDYKKQQLIQKNYEWALQHTWQGRAIDFVVKYIEQNDDVNEQKIFQNKKIVDFQAYSLKTFENDLSETFSHQELENLTSHINSDSSIVIEVGSFTGRETVLLSKYAKKVYAFEPVYESFSLLKENIINNDCNNVEIIQKAIGNKVEKINSMFMNKFLSPSDMSIENTTKVNVLQHDVNCEMITLDYFIENNLDVPDFLKIDVPGFEKEILQGAKNYLHKFKPIIYISHNGNFKDDTFMNSIDYMLVNSSINFSIYTSRNKNILITDGTNLEQNEWNILKLGAYIGNCKNDLIWKSLKNSMKVIFVEPIKKHFKKLENNIFNYFPNNNFVLINKAIDSTENILKNGNEISLYRVADSNDFSKLPWWIEQLSSTNKEHVKNHGFEIDLEEEKVPVISLNEIIEENNVKKLELLYIDVEGKEFDIIMDFDVEKLKPLFIIFEHLHVSDEQYNKIIDKFLQNNYEIIKETRDDTYLKYSC
jgi:FkbM family methyltransferase